MLPTKASPPQGHSKGGTRTDPRPYCPRPRWKFSFHSYQPQPGFPKEATSTRPRPLACPEEHWVWPLADSQANLTEPEKPKPYSSVFPNKTCARSDELCEVTRSAARKGPLLYPPRRLVLAYGFRNMYLFPSGQK